MEKKANLKSTGLRITVLLTFTFIILFGGCGTYFNGTKDVSNPGPQTNSQPTAPVAVGGIRTSYADVVDKTAAAVVQIVAVNTTGRSKRIDSGNPFDDFFNQTPNAPQQPRIRRGFGSGVIVSADGSILTNHHVIDEADKITVELSDNKSYNAKVIGSDPPSDLAVLKIEAKDLPFLKLGDSDAVRIGDIVLAIGNPLGIGQTVTSGIISAKGRRTGLGDGTSFQDFLQTDAPINQGNSGGALVNVNGELIGINSQILSNSAGGGSIGIGFAIPSNMARSVMEQLLKNGKVSRGMLGVNIQDIDSDMAETLGLKEAGGVIVSNVREGSAADKAGVKRGDVITKLNGEKVDDGNFLRNKVAETKPGTVVTLTILRDKKEEDVKVTLDELDLQNAGSGEENAAPPKENSEQNGKLGLSLQPLTPDIARRLNIPADTKGVIVTDVDSGSPADETGINRGDIILEINRQSVRDLDDVRAALGNKNGKKVLMLILRNGQTLFVTINSN